MFLEIKMWTIRIHIFLYSLWTPQIIRLLSDARGRHTRFEIQLNYVPLISFYSSVNETLKVFVYMNDGGSAYTRCIVKFIFHHLLNDHELFITCTFS